MTGRARVLAALEGGEPDRVPCALGFYHVGRVDDGVDVDFVEVPPSSEDRALRARVEPYAPDTRLGSRIQVATYERWQYRPQEPELPWGSAPHPGAGLANPLAVPRLEKVVVSMGMGKVAGEEGRVDGAAAELAQITGQKPVITKAKRAISNFKLRQGMRVGVMVTLRRRQMYEFLDRLVSVVIPRVKDFRGLNPNAFDGRGNYNMGLSEQTVFPEVDPAKVTFIQGMNITIVTTARTDDEGRALLSAMGFPFRRDGEI